MSNKELAYVEDIYNHEVLLIKYLEEVNDFIEDDNYVSLFKDQISTHKDLIKNLELLMERCYE